jgi:hypothetical protein
MVMLRGAVVLYRGSEVHPFQPPEDSFVSISNDINIDMIT